MATKNEGKAEDQAKNTPGSLAAEAYPERTAPTPDSKDYVIVARDDVPDAPTGRFSEQVLKGDAGAASGQELHPAENQPSYGVKAEDASKQARS